MGKATSWEKRGEAAERKAGQGPGAPEQDACLAKGAQWFEDALAEEAAAEVPASAREDFLRGYRRGIAAWAKKLGTRAWCKQMRADEGLGATPQPQDDAAFEQLREAALDADVGLHDLILVAAAGAADRADNAQDERQLALAKKYAAISDALDALATTAAALDAQLD